MKHQNFISTFAAFVASIAMIVVKSAQRNEIMWFKMHHLSSPSGTASLFDIQEGDIKDAGVPRNTFLFHHNLWTLQTFLFCDFITLVWTHKATTNFEGLYKFCLKMRERNLSQSINRRTQTRVFIVKFVVSIVHLCPIFGLLSTSVAVLADAINVIMHNVFSR